MAWTSVSWKVGWLLLVQEKVMITWRAERGSDAPALDMPNIYAQLDHPKSTILRYSDGS